MSTVGLLFVILLCVCVILAIGYQLDAMEARYEARLQRLAEEWEADRRGSARVVDFQAWRERKQDERGAA